MRIAIQADLLAVASRGLADQPSLERLQLLKMLIRSYISIGQLDPMTAAIQNTVKDSGLPETIEAKLDYSLHHLQPLFAFLHEVLLSQLTPALKEIVQSWIDELRTAQIDLVIDWYSSDSHMGPRERENLQNKHFEDNVKPLMKYEGMLSAFLSRYAHLYPHIYNK